ncbi:hypothetical protein CU633_07795 [Bacillus sp. V3-13]|uniref:hypothetical protein n=1 Tax=Bacillus sp. V3-13 TaxID=2053728 RepID=UPI000C7683F0|nr:hypothetical protein [Bacillus sp. V3-13]PLR78000.1 hypothetical protein CU633_07795 [Bacillus sp. V3-13]
MFQFILIMGCLLSWGYQVGSVYANELFSYYGHFSEGNGAVSIGFYSPNGWRQGYVKPEHATSAFLRHAYSPQYGSPFLSDYAFKVLHRQSRIFSGDAVITAVQPGGWVISDGYSEGGSTYPYNVPI